MDFQWIMLAFLLVFMIMGSVKAMWGSFLKNMLRLACVPVAFLLAWIIQLTGGFQAIVNSVVAPLMKNLIEGELSHDTEAFITATASTLASTILFGLTFLLFLMIFRIVAKVIYKNISKKEEKDENGKPKKEKFGLRFVSILSGAMCGFLILGVMLMPLFYVMDLASSASSLAQKSECDDSQIYRVLDVIDEDIVQPYEKGITTNIYKYTSILPLMNATTSLGGKIVTETGDKAYATNTIKALLSSGGDIVITLQSKKADGANLSADIKNLFSDPIILSVVADFAMSKIENMELDEEKAHTDLLSALSMTMKGHYAGEDKKQFSNDIHAFGDAIACLNDYDHLIPLFTNKNTVSGLGDLINDQECLEETVHILTDVSSYDALLETVYEFEIESICEMLDIPNDDSEAYDVLIEHLVGALNSVEVGSVSVENVGYFASRFADSGESLETIFEANKSSYDKTLYNNWNKYQKAWRSVQDAFSASCEDTSLGAIWIEYNGNKYFYDGTAHVWSKGDQVADKYSPVSPLCQYLVTMALKREGEVTEDLLIQWLKAYTDDSSASSALAKKIVNKEGFVSSAVTYEKMLAAADFKSWDEESRRKDSKLIVQVIMKLKGVAEGLASSDPAEDNYITTVIGHLGTLGEAMDLMYETTCVKELPTYLTEGMLQNETFRKYINAGVVRELNNAVKDHDNMTYTSFMHSIRGIISLVLGKIDEFGGAIQ